MSNPRIGLSYCIGVYNEEVTLFENIKKIKNGLKKIIGHDRYEIILVENGSTDKTRQLLKHIRDPHIKFYFIKDKGHGNALRLALNKAQYNNIVITAIDLPFGFDDLKKALTLWQKRDIIFGSKAHKDSVIRYSIKRKFASFVFRNLLKTLFSNQIQDPQGSIFLKKNKVLPFLKYCTAENAFFTVQIAIYGQKYGLKMTEIPINMKQSETGRKSKYNIVTDGYSILLSMIKEFFNLKKIV